MSAHEQSNSMRRRLLLAPVGIGIATVLQPLSAVAQSASNSKLRIGVIGVWAHWRHHRRPVGQGRPPGAVFVAPPGRAQGACRARLGPLAQRRPRRRRDQIRRRRSSSRCRTARCPQIGRDYGAALKGKIVLDASNAVPARDGDIAQEAERDGIGMTSQKYLPGTRLVRAFNTSAYSILRARSEPRPTRAGDPDRW